MVNPHFEHFFPVADWEWHSLDEDESLHLFYFRIKTLTWICYIKHMLLGLKQCDDFRVMEWNGMEFIATTRGEWRLLNDKCLYNKNKTGNSGHISWESVGRMSDSRCCQHTHSPNSKLTAVKKRRANVKKDARNADLTIKCTVSANIAGGNWRFSRWNPEIRNCLA